MLGGLPVIKRYLTYLSYNTSKKKNFARAKHRIILQKSESRDRQKHAKILGNQSISTSKQLPDSSFPKFTYKWNCLVLLVTYRLIGTDHVWFKVVHKVYPNLPLKTENRQILT